MYCKNCEHKLDDNADVCLNCGVYTDKCRMINQANAQNTDYLGCSICSVNHYSKLLELEAGDNYYRQLSSFSKYDSKSLNSFFVILVSTSFLVMRVAFLILTLAAYDLFQGSLIKFVVIICLIHEVYSPSKFICDYFFTKAESV